MKLIVFLLLFFNVSMAATLPFAKVVRVKGNVTFKNESLFIGQKLKGKGSLRALGGSFAKIMIPKWNNTIVIGPHSQMELNLDSSLPEKEKMLKTFLYKLKKGLCRWQSLEGQARKKGTIHTKNASIGVRGTDFILKTSKILAETEVIVFNGKVEFRSKLKKDDTAIVGAGQWGGVGGRFGKSIGNLIDLPSDVLGHFKKLLK